MPSRKVSKPHIVVPNGMSEEENSSGSEDELENVQKKLKSQSMTDENSSSTEYSDSDESSEQEPPKRKKKKKMHWSKRPFVPPPSTFAGNSPPIPTSIEEPIDYFYSMFGQDSFTLLKEQSNLYSVQVNPNRPVQISD